LDPSCVVPILFAAETGAHGLRTISFHHERASFPTNLLQPSIVSMPCSSVLIREKGEHLA
jgi:hypothetical protein